jgi:hypothetical protein
MAHRANTDERSACQADPAWFGLLRICQGFYDTVLDAAHTFPLAAGSLTPEDLSGGGAVFCATIGRYTDTA